jgi:hypothetical protein
MKKVQKNKQPELKLEKDGFKKTKLKPLPKDKYKPTSKVLDDEEEELEDDLFSYDDDDIEDD